MFFKNREEAGENLGKILKAKNWPTNDIVIYALPRGGVVTALEIAKILKSPLDLIITRKIGHPYEPEYALAVVSESGNLTGNKLELSQVDEKWLEEQIEKEKQEIARRKELYLKGRRSIKAEGKIAIIVDDGIATGLTMKAAVAVIKSQQPKKIIVAVPVAPQEVASEIRKSVDEFIALDIPDNYLGAVGNYYEEFPQVTDDEVIKALTSL